MSSSLESEITKLGFSWAAFSRFTNISVPTLKKINSRDPSVSPHKAAIVWNKIAELKSSRHKTAAS